MKLDAKRCAFIFEQFSDNSTKMLTQYNMWYGGVYELPFFCLPFGVQGGKDGEMEYVVAHQVYRNI